MMMPADTTSLTNKPYRYQVYERYAQLVKERGVRWVMLHGAENYPESIGRDLDCLCASQADTDAALDCFRCAAQEVASTRWICFPHPIWGRRCVAVSGDYESAELHILPCLSSGPVAHRVDYESVDRSAVFPREERAFYIKAVVMPILGNSPKAGKAMEMFGETKLPDCIKRAYGTLLNKGRISIGERLAIYAHHCESPAGALRGLLHSFKNKLWRYRARTVPVFYLPENVYPAEELEQLRQALQQPFLKFKDCTALSRMKVRCLQSQQFFLYTRRATILPDCVDTQELHGKELYDFIMQAFAELASARG